MTHVDSFSLRQFILTAVSLVLLSASAAAAPIQFSVELDGDHVVPMPSGSTATATANFTLNTGTSPSLDYFITVNGLDLDGTATMGFFDDDVVGIHIHAAPVGSNGPLVYGIFGPLHDLDGDQVIDSGAGTISGSWDDDDFLLNNSIERVVDHIGEILSGGLYIQIHTNAFPGPNPSDPLFPVAEVRGQFPAIPEPPAWALWLLLGAVAGVAMRHNCHHENNPNNRKNG